jgi:hypothetical protein
MQFNDLQAPFRGEPHKTVVPCNIFTIMTEGIVIRFMFQ